jgi:hypothetical protein
MNGCHPLRLFITSLMLFSYLIFLLQLIFLSVFSDDSRQQSTRSKRLATATNVSGSKVNRPSANDE